MLEAQLGDRICQSVVVAVARVAGDEDVPAHLEELLAERIELLRAVGETVQQNEGSLGSAAVGVEPGLTDGVDVRAVEVLDARGDPNGIFVCIATHSPHPICNDLLRGFRAVVRTACGARAVPRLCRGE